MLLIVLTSCTTVDVPVLSQEAVQETPLNWQNSLAVETQQAPAPDLRSWWKVFNDAGLNKLIERALTQNLQLAQVQARIRQARFMLGHSGDAFLPSLRLFSENASSADASDSFFQYGLDANWEISLFGRREGNLRMAQGQLGSAEAEVQSARVSIVAEVARTWTELRAGQQLQRLQEHVIAQDAKRISLLMQRQTLGLTSNNDIERARLQQTQDKAALLARKQVVAQSAQRLAVLLGQPAPDADWLNTPGDPPQLTQTYALQAVPADLLRTRPDILRAEANVMQAAGELGVARSDMYPRLSIGAGYIFSTVITKSSSFQGSNTNSGPYIGPIIDIPLFDWGRRQAAANAQGEALNASVLAYRQTVLEAVAEVENALTTMNLQRERVTQQREALGSIRKNLDAQRTLIGLGLSSNLNGLDDARTQLQLSQELIDAQATQTIAFVALYKALGGAPLPENKPEQASSVSPKSER